MMKKTDDKLAKWLKIFLLAVLVVGTINLIMKGDWSAKQSVIDSYDAKHQEGQITTEDFAKCLNKSAVVMYGEDTCEYCQLQKKMFGAAFKEINYINCRFDTKLCLSKGITQYPVWERNDKLILGIQRFPELSELSGGCPIPIEKNN